MLSCHIFVGVSRRLFSSTVPCNNSSEMLLGLQTCPWTTAARLSLYFAILVGDMPLCYALWVCVVYSRFTEETSIQKPVYTPRSVSALTATADQDLRAVVVELLFFLSLAMPLQLNHATPCSSFFVYRQG